MGDLSQTVRSQQRLESLRGSHAIAAGILVLSLVLAVVAGTIGPGLLPVGSVARGPALPAQGPGRPATDEEQREIIAAMMLGPQPAADHLFPELQPVGSMVLLSSSLVLCGGSESDCGTRTSAHLPEANRVDPILAPLMPALRLANAKSVSLPDPGLADLRIATVEELVEAWGRGERHRFQEYFAGALREVRVSRAVVSVDGRHAQLFHVYFCGELCGQGTVIRFAREGSAWRIDATDGVWYY